MSTRMNGISLSGKIHAKHSGGSALFNGGSALFNGSSYFSVPGSGKWNLATGEDMTIEWFQYQTDLGIEPRLFSVGGYPTASIALSLAGTTMSFWLNDVVAETAETTSNLNVWKHFAVVRYNDIATIYEEGTAIISVSLADAEDEKGKALFVGSETGSNAPNSFFTGNITNFRWTKGEAVYTSNFVVPRTPLTADANTQVLLTEMSADTLLADTSGNGITITNVGGMAWSPLSPFD